MSFKEVILFTLLIIHYLMLMAATVLVLVCALLKLAQQNKPALEAIYRWASWVMAGLSAILILSSIYSFFLTWYNESSFFTTVAYGLELNSHDHFWLLLALTLIPSWIGLLPAIRQVRQRAWLTALICGIILALNLGSSFQ